MLDLLADGSWRDRKLFSRQFEAEMAASGFKGLHSGERWQSVTHGTHLPILHLDEIRKSNLIVQRQSFERDASGGAALGDPGARRLLCKSAASMPAPHPCPRPDTLRRLR